MDNGYSNNDFHAVYVRKIWKIGSTCGLCLYVYFSVLKSVHMETPTIKKRLIRFCDTDKVRRINNSHTRKRSLKLWLIEIVMLEKQCILALCY